MARIVGVNIPNHQHTVIGLQAIYGIGKTRAQAICQATGVTESTKVKDLTDAEMEKLCVTKWPSSPLKVICAVKSP